MFVIKNKKTGEFWSNDWGWGTIEGCEMFSDDSGFDLPTDGEWVDVDYLQWDEITNN